MQATRPLTLLFALGLAAVLTSGGCGAHDEGERCDSVNNGNDDCEDPLVCVQSSQLRNQEVDRCCPANGTHSDERCERGGGGGTGGTGGTGDAAVDAPPTDAADAQGGAAGLGGAAGMSGGGGQSGADSDAGDASSVGGAAGGSGVAGSGGAAGSPPDASPG
jgi:hypothetical protein